MNYEMTLYLPQPTRLYLQDGFFNTAPPSAAPHRHRYGELHFADGAVHYEIDGIPHTLSGSEALFIPAGKLHRCVLTAPELRHTAFQLPLSLPLTIKKLPTGFTKELFSCLRSGRDSVRLRGLLTFLISYFTNTELPPTPTDDRGFVIYEFFANRYHENLTLGDLADLLGLSIKQTAREVKKQMGRSFREEITARRLEAAGVLLALGVSAPEAAEAVGYRSYSGFWKAYHK